MCRTEEKDATTEVLGLWTQFIVLLSNICNTAAITRLNAVFLSTETEGINDFRLEFIDNIESIEAFEKELNYRIQNDLPNLIYEKAERLFCISDGREQTISCLKNLVQDLKNTKINSERYQYLNILIISSFNTLNVLLNEMGRILKNSNYEIKSSEYDLTPITKSDIGWN